MGGERRYPDWMFWYAFRIEQNVNKLEYSQRSKKLYLTVCELDVWLDTKCPYLIEDNSKAPHVTGSGVLLVVESLWSCPFHRDFPSTERYSSQCLSELETCQSLQSTYRKVDKYMAKPWYIIQKLAY